jgi:hypothetical protein
MYRLQDPADRKDHLCHIDELYEYRMPVGLTDSDDVVHVIALDQFQVIVHWHSIVDSDHTEGSREEQVTVGPGFDS